MKTRFFHRRLAAILILCLCLLLQMSVMAEELPPRHQVLYFYENYCETCHPEEDFAVSFEKLTGLALSECDFQAYNIVRSDGRKALERAVETYHIANPKFPLTIVDENVYNGTNEFNQALPQQSLDWNDTTDSIILYLYVPACESCGEVKALLDRLPDAVTIRRGNFTFDSAVRVEPIDVSQSPEIAAQLFEQYDVSDEDRITPIVFFGTHYLAGAEKISGQLSFLIGQGWGVGGVLPIEAEQSSEINPLSLFGTLGAGLAAGFNTCALSMLLLFLSLVLENRQNAPLLVISFLSAKFVTYLLIGLVLLNVLQQFNPTWLLPLSKYLLTGIGGILIALNLWDAWQAHLSNYGKIRNQLPTKFKSRLHRILRAVFQKKVLIPTAAILGVIVALGEFLCAGQLYLMQLLSSLKSGASEQLLGLFVYCIAFLTPSILLCIPVLHRRSQSGISMFLAEHMSAAKLITAAAMLILILSAWLL